MAINKLVFVILLSVTALVTTSCSPDKISESHPLLLSEEIQVILDKERNIIHREMDNPVYVAILHTANAKKETLSEKTILELDQQWAQESPKDVSAQTILNAPCSEQLRTFRSNNPEFAEIFITDERGRNVCMTNKTSDYYQADEAWWINTKASSDPFGLHGPIEFDDSASTESISLYLPVLDPATGNTLGILKAVVKLSSLAEAL